MCLTLKERGIPFEPVFMDTGWELPETYDYLLDVLPKHIGEIWWLRAEVTLDPVREAYAQELEGMLGHYSAMVRWCLKKNMAPKRLQRWCTEKLKLNPMIGWSKTKRGGKQVELFTAPPRDAGCMRWGMCDTGSTK